MTSPHHQILQAELDRIEANAAAQSLRLINKSTTLAAAVDFCVQINADNPLWHCRPSVLHHPNECGIVIFPPDARSFVRYCREHGFVLHENKPDNFRRLKIDALPDVEFLFDVGGSAA